MALYIIYSKSLLSHLKNPYVLGGLGIGALGLGGYAAYKMYQNSKKKNKKPKKTIVYEESSSEEEEPAKPVRKERETKTQQNSASKFKVTQSVAEKPKSIYYFAE